MSSINLIPLNESEANSMARVLLAGSDKISGLVVKLLEGVGHDVTQRGDAATAVGLIEGEHFKMAVVKSCLSVDGTTHSVSCFSGHPAEIWVAAACQRRGIPCVIFHENLCSDWYIRMAKEYLGAVVVVRPSSQEDDPDYNQEDQAFAQMIVEAAVKAYRAKLSVPVR